MGKTKNKFLLLVLIFVRLVFVGAVVLVYVYKVQPEFNEYIKWKKLEALDLKSRIEKGALMSFSETDQMSLASLVNEAKLVYGQSEQSNNEGILWVNSESSERIITLGAIHGVFPGQKLTVYESDQAVGQVVVERAFDVISFVQPLGGSFEISENSYYRVVKH